MGQTARKSGKRRHRPAKTRAPEVISRQDYIIKNNCSEDNVHYGVITKYHGSHGKCTVNLSLPSGIITINARLKKSLQLRRCGQRLSSDKIVLVDDTYIVLVYQNDDASSVIDFKDLKILQREIPKDIVETEENDPFAFPYEDEEDEDDVFFGEEEEFSVAQLQEDIDAI